MREKNDEYAMETSSRANQISINLSFKRLEPGPNGKHVCMYVILSGKRLAETSVRKTDSCAVVLSIFLSFQIILLFG